FQFIKNGFRFFKLFFLFYLKKKFTFSILCLIKMMYKNLNLFVILSLLLLLVNKVVYGQNFIPGPRVGQASVLVGDRIYYIGGPEVTPLSNFFYLEFDKTWIDLVNL